MFQLPTTTAHFQALQRQFNERLLKVYDQAKAIVTKRAKHYDVRRPVWERVSFPHGFMHEISKKHGRVKAQIDRGEVCMELEAWEHTREDLLDEANYLIFMVVYGDMLREELALFKGEVTPCAAEDHHLQEKLPSPPKAQNAGLPNIPARVA